ncbi:Putative AC transposase [Linum grandiflorum]
MKSTNSRGGGGVNRKPLKRKRGNNSTTLMRPPRLHQPLRVETPPSQAPPSSRQAPPPAPPSSSRAIPTTPSSSSQAPARHVSPSSEAPLMPPAPFPREIWDDKLGVRHTYKICQKRAEIMKGQMRLDFQQGSGLEITNWKYDPVKLRQKIAIMIILDELPFRFVEKEGFRGVMKETSPLFKMPCRKTIRADCLRLFLDAFKRLEDDKDTSYVTDLTAKSYDNQIIGPPQHENWVSVRKLLPFLGAFYDLTLVVSGTKYVTIHLFMIEILKIFTHIGTMQECGDESISCMVDKMLEKMVKYWDDSDENNPKLNSSSQKTDLDIYLSIGREDVHTLNDPDCKYDILLWWKNNGHRHPLLCEMVRDIFGVPISSVSSESAFSTGGQILDSFRSSLTPSIVEALICSGDWLRSSNSSLLPDEEDLDELAKIEKVGLACALAINEEVNDTFSQAVSEPEIGDDGEEYTDDMDNNWDGFIPCSNEEQEV